VRLSLVITSKTLDDPKLHELLKSISTQTLPKSDYEIIVVTEGTSESAKAIGIRKAKGDVICILASDNEFTNPGTLLMGLELIDKIRSDGAYPSYYHYNPQDPALNRYFSIIGANDPLAFALGKSDRYPLWVTYVPIPIGFPDRVPTLGDNCFFIRRDVILKANLDSYYHIDVCEDLRRLGHYRYAVLPDSIWHKTGDGSIFSFLRRRARFGIEHAFNGDRRWHLVDKRDTPRLLLFALSSATLVYPTLQALKWFRKVKDPAVFLHPVLCLGICFTYALALASLAIKRLSQSLFAHSDARRY